MGMGGSGCLVIDGVPHQKLNRCSRRIALMMREGGVRLGVGAGVCVR